MGEHQHRLRDDRLTSPTRLAAVPDTRLPDDDGPRDRGRWLLAGLVLVALLLIAGVVYLVSGGNDVQGQRDAAVGQSLGLAQQVSQACASGQLAPSDRLCAQAAQVQAEPIPGTPGMPGVDGAPGRDGVDGRNGVDGAPGVPGADGPPGSPGADGADGAPGSPGADGAAGQPGQDGAAGRPPAGFSFVDGAGRTQQCTRDAGSPDDAATYTCTAGSTAMPSSMRLFFPT